MTATSPHDGLQLPPGARVGVFSLGLLRVQHLATLLGARSLHVFPYGPRSSDVDYVVGWGRKASARRARAYAAAHGVPFVAAEDGFLRSVGLGVDGAPALSLALDDVGMYYDATVPSRLERMLAGHGPEAAALDDPELLTRAEAAIARIVEAGLSKYNGSSTRAVLPPTARRRVLVVDQTRDDLSLKLGHAPPGGVRDVLLAAIADHPNAEIVLKTHPDALTGKRPSSAGAEDLPRGVVRITEPINPIRLLQSVQHVYVATSQMGFEALMVGLPVTCFGAPFYAGWGLTDDRAATPRRSRARNLAQVFAAAYLRYCVYVDPQTGRPGQLEDVIEHLARQRHAFADNAAVHYAFGFSRWKHDFVRAYMRSPDGEVRFVRDAAHARRLGVGAEDRLLAWGQKDDADVRALSANTEAPIVRMEDGFLRSVQLGSDLTIPASLVVDADGLYYDPRTSSALERILQHETFEHEELQRAARLRESILATRVSKYGVGGRSAIAAAAAPGQTVVLVPGQVPGDASILLGCPGIRDNLALLDEVRRALPEAYIVFKPHPDVLSGNRHDGTRRSDFEAACDELVTDVHIADCLDAAAEVHTLTSLVGFEGLLRGLRVVTYGQPFYSGWGLTEDRCPLARRSRRLSLDALVAGTLLRYPRYVHPATGEFVEPEAIVDYLAEGHAGAARRRSLLVRQLQRLSRALTGATHAR